MPEIPDLEAIRAFLNERIVGVEITGAQTPIPYIFRTPAKDVAAGLIGNRFGEVLRRGKFLLFTMADEHVLVINPMLTGRFQYVAPDTKKRAKTCLALALANGQELRYADDRLMGKIYYVHVEDVLSIPQFAEMGPDALEVSEEEFRQRIRKHPGAIKNILTNHTFIAGIGNAYADEILFEARINPFRKRTTLSDAEIGALYRAIGTTLRRSMPILRAHFRDELDYEEWRDHLKVHRKGGDGKDKQEGRCPRCGTHITEIAPNQRITSYCRTCQR
ncbi:MAG: Fpg/Nei family DNA glycosylase [Chloroflexota bacterium]|nr:Fpg/Nei family DNA glycosylase [Chloroflexota bacterium]